MKSRTTPGIVFRAAVGAAGRAFAHTNWGRDRALRSRALLELAEGFEARASELALVGSLRA